MKIGDLVKFKDITGDFPGIQGDLAMVVEADEWAIVVEWLNDAIVTGKHSPLHQPS